MYFLLTFNHAPSNSHALVFHEDYVKNRKLMLTPSSTYCSSDNQGQKTPASLKQSFPPEQGCKHSTVNTLCISVPWSFCQRSQHPPNPPPAAEEPFMSFSPQNTLTRDVVLVYTVSHDIQRKLKFPHVGHGYSSFPICYYVQESAPLDIVTLFRSSL